jgi:hypothetical protein
MLLATLAIGGAGLAAASYFVNVLDLPRFPAEGNGVWARAWADRLHLTVFLVPMILGIAVYLWALRRFKRGLDEERWPEASLAPVRSLLRRPWGWCGFVLFALACLLFIYVKKDLNGAVYLLILPSDAVWSLRRLVNPPAEFSSTVSLDLSSAQPLRSEHWGESRV